VTTRAVAAALLVGLLSAAWPRAAGAQDEGWPRVYAAIDGTYRAVYEPFEQTIRYEHFLEEASFTAAFDAVREPTYGVTVGVRIWRALGAGVAVTRVRSRTTALVEGDIPHPFLFEQLRHVSGQTDPIAREELALHAQIRVFIPVRSRFDVVLFAGPSRWEVQQAVLDGVQYAEQYPYDTAEFERAVLTSTRTAAWGYNGGVDISAYFTRNIGVGLLLEVATATLPQQAPDGTTRDSVVGGLRGGAGIRLRF
jgi:hypothetical protein